MAIILEDKLVPILTILSLALAATDSQTSCLVSLRTTRGAKITGYDEQNDAQEGGSISCAYGLTPSEVEQDLRRIRAAATGPGCVGLDAVVHDPVTISFGGSRPQKIHRRDVCRFSRQIKAHLRRHLGELTLDRLQLMGWRGALTGDETILLNTMRMSRSRNRFGVVGISSIRR